MQFQFNISLGQLKGVVFYKWNGISFPTGLPSKRDAQAVEAECLFTGQQGKEPASPGSAAYL